jgi:hypothetical protein
MFIRTANAVTLANGIWTEMQRTKETGTATDARHTISLMVFIPTSKTLKDSPRRLI